MGRPLILAFLLVFALPMGAAGVPTGPSPPAAALDDVAILTLNGSERTSFAVGAVDVGTSLAVQHDSAAARLDRYALDERMRNTDSSAARQALLFETAAGIEDRIASLREEEQALRSAYATRDIETVTFVRGLAEVHAGASELRASLVHVQAHADDIPEFSMRSRVRELDATLFGFQGPVRGRALVALRGDAAGIRLFVSASEQGVVLSVIEDGRYVRETYRADNRDTERDNNMGINEVDERATELYPLAYDPSTSIRTGIQSLTGGLYRIEMELREGLITAYLDGTTQNVFFELQERRLDLLGERPTAVETANGTRVVVHRSYTGGPLQVAVTNNETDAPMQTAVIVGRTRLETGPDGSAWTLTPAGSFDVTVLGPRGNVSVTVRPFVPTAVDTSG